MTILASRIFCFLCLIFLTKDVWGWKIWPCFKSHAGNNCFRYDNMSRHPPWCLFYDFILRHLYIQWIQSNFISSPVLLAGIHELWRHLWISPYDWERLRKSVGQMPFYHNNLRQFHKLAELSYKPFSGFLFKTMVTPFHNTGKTKHTKFASVCSG